MLAEEKNKLSADGIQPVDDIAEILKVRSSPSAVSRVIDANTKYTIEDVYKNEITFKQKQAQINVEDENKYIGVEQDKWAQGDEKKARYLKGYNIWSSLNSTSISRIAPLLKSLDKHELYVAVRFKDGYVELIAQRPRTITRDGVKQKVIDEVNPVEMPFGLLEDKKPQGYGLSIEKLRLDEESLHDKKALQWYKKNCKTSLDEEQTEDTEENNEEKTVEEKQEEQPKNAEAPKTQQQTPNQEDQEEKNSLVGQVVQTLNSLETVKENPKQEQVQEEVVEAPVQSAQTDDFDSFDDSDFVRSLIEEMMEQGSQIYDPKAHVVKQPTPEPQSIEQNYVPKEQAQRVFESYDDTQYDSQPQVQEQKKQMATIHQMKVDNFKKAASEVKQRILDIYNGDERKASQDADYARLMSFVQETLKKQAEKASDDTTEIDWSLPQNQQIQQQDFLNKRKSFEKTYNEDTFARIEQRVGNTF